MELRTDRYDRLVRARGAMRTAGWACALALLAAPTAQAQSEREQRAALEVFRDYAPDGEIDPCKHTANELKLAQDNIPPDIEQYAADYPAAIAAAIDARARGECDPEEKAAAPAATATPAATPTPAPTPAPGAKTTTVVPDPPGPDPAPAATNVPAASDAAIERIATARSSSDAPAPVLGLGLLAAALALLAVGLVAARRFGVGDDRLAGPAHAIREARWRAAGTWQDFLDWVRLGR
jgi:hypothetical protein